ncbi:uncharacterized protein LOC130628848 [Hydractinia symbiolongicarpus]|uniref:uncharacterized protein LOC130628848 n=1 Tax=Hydractinia symbiolongicarpus TaxID=13093 RepID=UPI00254DA9CB|nr:uncharacterized protein LOC130628848 [Hydractinia symbiolongicarpus]
MPAFFVRAKPNEALIFETLGVPLSVARRWSIIPFPCCQMTRRFNIGQCKIKFEGDDVITKDNKKVTLTCWLTFVIDGSSKKNIMKAYKDFCGIKKSRESKVTNGSTEVECAIIDIVNECMMLQLLKMTLKELIQFNWLFVDAVFTRAKYILIRNCVNLQELRLLEIKEYTKIADQLEYEEENIFEEEVEVVLNTSNTSTQIGLPNRLPNSISNGLPKGSAAESVELNGILPTMQNNEVTPKREDSKIAADMAIIAEVRTEISNKELHVDVKGIQPDVVCMSNKRETHDDIVAESAFSEHENHISSENTLLLGHL